MKIIKLALFAFVGVAVASCDWGPGALDETQDQVLTVAYKSETADFSKFQSYAITDSISVVYKGKKFRLQNDTTDLIIAQVVQNMNKNGYKQVAAQSNPNLVVDVSYIQSTNTTIYPGYWNDWDWWWDSYHYPWQSWYPYYPYHMPTVISSYTTGSVIIEIADMVNIASESS
ncbi:MAG: DUF4136 domain-containing protein, partial [Bacteroidales bacterium]